MQIIETKINTILRQTGINLAPHVINPYQGCGMGCLFCYSQFNKVSLKERRPWGSYVKVKINAPEILEKEIKRLNPEKVLLGSTTECFQPVEKKYKITEAILKILNKRKINYIILTRSLLIADYLAILKKGFCESIYFTLDILPSKLRKRFEPKVPSWEKTLAVVNKLSQNGINIIAYFSPLMPWLFDGQKMFSQLKNIKQVEFEVLNFKMANTDKIIKDIEKFYPELANSYKRLMNDKNFYDKTINELKDEITNSASKCFKTIKIHSHKFEGYFNNTY